MPKGVPKNPKPCPRCTGLHHRLGYCKDGVRLAGANAFTKKTNPKVKQAVEPESSVVVVSTAPEAPVAADSHAEIRDMIATLPEGSSQRKALENLLERDAVRTQHDKDEEDYRARTGNPDARLPLPTILRDKSEEKGAALNRELDRFLYTQGVNPNKRETSNIERKANLTPEAQAVHDTLAGLEAAHDLTERQAALMAAKPEHPTGSTGWFCNDCKKGFLAADLDYIRRKAKAEPEWRFLCPHCMGIHVQLTMSAVA